ncbi:hypothetical protein D3218_13860 [Aureimonas flava]|uniref:Type I secretion protein n=1 Tax=Aureimonas flava TaxID=2320271 RepID=A0A3A1WIR8_9HYPH|nr:hypothetical protein [Aureimonas flava]RIX99553.1 hypothetical protein D3218_13860 [Aureimonas flava]
MLVTEAQETIARFIGYFDLLEVDPRLRKPVTETNAEKSGVHLPDEDATPDASGVPGYAAPGFNPRIAFGNDTLAIEPAGTHRLAAHDVDVGPHAIRFSHHEAVGLPLQLDDPARSPVAPSPVPVYVYDEIHGDSLSARVTQLSVMDDRDTVILDPDAAPLDAVDAIAKTFVDMVRLAEASTRLPAVPADADGLRQLLRHDAPDGGADGAGNAVGPAEHEGTWWNGAQVETGPSLADRLEAHRLAQDLPPVDADWSGMVLRAGDNAQLNEARLVSEGYLGKVSAVLGDWHETNAIYQLNVVAERDVVEGVEASRIQFAEAELWNVARFHRMDATPGAAPPPGVGSFPVNYRVDVIEGDIQITNVLRQIAFMRDGDRVVLSAQEQWARLLTGGNETVDLATLSKLFGAYDLVVIGGSVYEGNFIQQINVLSDSDHVLSEGGRVGSVATAGNFAANTASIVNVGSVADFKPLSPEMSALVARFSAGEGSGALHLGADLAFIAGRDIRVLYVKGDVLELNVVSQINILEDSDTVRAPAASLVADLQAGKGGGWSVSTGHNAQVNKATILDLDDAAHHRFLGGEYYSQSMLAQTDLVGAHDGGVQTFDVSVLAPEIIAFIGNVHADDAHHASASLPFHDAHGTADGVAGILT